jgi:hypothetical protein
MKKIDYEKRQKNFERKKRKKKIAKISKAKTRLIMSLTELLNKKLNSL